MDLGGRTGLRRIAETMLRCCSDMYQVSSEQHRSIVSAILRSPVRPPKSMRGLDWRRFLQTYFANVDEKDLAERDPKDLAGAALSHLLFAMQRRRTALVRVFNPTFREHGFVSPQDRK